MSGAGAAMLSRRHFMTTAGALLVAFAWPARSGAQQDEGKPGLPGSLKKESMLDGWIRIEPDGRVTVLVGKAELGQGIKTALLQLAAEELVVAPGRITLISADSLRIADGVISAPDGRRVGYGELVKGQELHRQATPDAVLHAPGHYQLIGKPLARIDLPAKVAGGAAYVHDLRPAGMVHARVVRPPSPGAALRALDSARAERMPGVVKVVRDGRFIAVLAQREYQAVRAAAVLGAAASWDEQPTLPPQAELYQSLTAAPSQPTTILEQGVAGAAGRTLEAEYRRPFLLHGSIGPSCALALLAEGKYTVWTHSQGVFPLRAALAELLDVDQAQLRCIHAEGAGCYGHNGADDVAADAVLLAHAWPGHPVRVQWMREDEHAWEPCGPPMLARAKATLDADGKIADWQYEVWSPPHNARPGQAGNLLAAIHLATPFTPPPAKPIPQPEGGGDRNAIPLYGLPNARVVHHFLPTAALRTSALRSLGAYHNVFAIESFMDELARAAGTDPVAFRLKHMQDQRALEVMRLAAARFGWDAYPRQPRRGRGFAFARYKNLGAYAACALEVEVARDTGLLRVTRAVAAVDSGEIVNLDGIRNQIEGGLVQACSWTLCEQAQFDATRVTSRDWAAYPILRFPQVPERVEVHVIERPGQPFLGTGEAAQGPAAAAIANALADATGVRLRELPFDRARVHAALDLRR